MTESNRRVLITGGAGFIGSHLVRVCLDSGADVCVYDDFSRGRADFLPSSSRLKVVKGDILDQVSLTAAIREVNPGIVYHLAAIHHIPTCENQPREALRVNVEGTQSVLTASLAAADCRVVMASTGAVYANTGSALKESDALEWHELYGISKLCAEDLGQYHASKHGRTVIAARLFNSVGPHETNAHVIPDILFQLAEGKTDIRIGNLNRKRDYVHVMDVAEGFGAIGVARDLKGWDVFNVGSGTEHSVMDLIQTLAKILGKEIHPVQVAELQRRVDRPSQLADTGKLSRLTGWTAKRSFRQALADALADHPVLKPATKVV